MTIKTIIEKATLPFIFSLPFWVVAIGLWTGGISVERTVIEAPNVPTQVTREFVEFEGWDCEEDERQRWDLLQPSGVWEFRTLECYKLQIPIEEYCKTNPCSYDRGVY